MVWGAKAAGYHKHNYIYQHIKEVVRKLCPSKMLQLDVLGGARIAYRARGVVCIWLFSCFGPAPHELSAAVKVVPLYGSDAITISYKGY